MKNAAGTKKQLQVRKKKKRCKLHKLLALKTEMCKTTEDSQLLVRLNQSHIEDRSVNVRTDSLLQSAYL